MAYIKRTEPIALKIEEHDFGLVDHKKRVVGAQVVTWEEDHTAVKEPGPQAWCQGTPGHKFYSRVHNMRNRIPYGASQSGIPFNSASERAAHISKYLRSAQRRFAKQFARWNEVR